ncbi:MAG TPA: molecular chaperone TorD family protein [Ktedonosporobacter sp.]|jgi:hypothetical protein|nr:molecular chaperone TorD family protein [Ktedonosporobacter sp.]
MSDDLKSLLEEVRYIVAEPLRVFRKWTSPLDQIHQEYVQKFYNSVFSLFEGNYPFTGQGADSLAQLLGDYMQAESNETGFGPDGTMSETLDHAATLCERAAGIIEHDIDTFPFKDAPPNELLGGLIIIGGKKIWLPDLGDALILALVAAAGTEIIITDAQQAQLDDMNAAKRNWNSDMENWAVQREHANPLPAEPKDPQKFIVPGAIIFNSADPVEDDLLSEWEKGNITDEEFETALNLHATYPGLDAADLIALARALSSGRLSWGRMVQLLNQLCGGLPGLGRLIVDSEVNGNQQAANLLQQLLEQANLARSTDPGNAVGAQRVLSVLKQLGLDNVAGLEIPSGTETPIDILLNDGTAIEVGGSGKADAGTQFGNYRSMIGKTIDGIRIRSVRVYIDNGGGKGKDAMDLAKTYFGPENVFSFENDISC